MTDKRYAVVPWEVLELALGRLEDVFGKQVKDIPTINDLRAILYKGPAEPVAWLHRVRQDSDVLTNAVKHAWGNVAVGREAQYTIPLFRAPEDQA